MLVPPSAELLKPCQLGSPMVGGAISVQTPGGLSRAVAGHWQARCGLGDIFLACKHSCVCTLFPLPVRCGKRRPLWEGGVDGVWILSLSCEDAASACPGVAPGGTLDTGAAVITVYIAVWSSRLQTPRTKQGFMDRQAQPCLLIEPDVN